MEAEDPFEPIEDDDLSEDELKVLNWRLKELLDMELELPMAKVAARSGLDLEELRNLVRKQGCPPALAVRILSPV